MSNILEYKGYLTTVCYSLEDNVLHGKLEGIAASVDFYSEPENGPEGIADAFHQAVDDYLELCKDAGIKPNIPFKGNFNVRVAPDVHRRIWIDSNKQKISINQFVKDAIDEKLNRIAPKEEVKTVVYETNYILQDKGGFPFEKTESIDTFKVRDWAYLTSSFSGEKKRMC